ncbi:MAG: hypothetical protein KF794_09930 [Xanthobacteraceae bacterium]|nr:hypothetical protein [Xanthobacteraceae bacterium]QYK44112.1 MAG: hypothetical protein KF794_09930 [Xanthobacteraceae bacterium]HMN51409.1 hypothetical protein [Xanthobacteraceae bacterium]
MKSAIRAAFLGLLLLASAPAHANWEFTRWGMSLDQLMTFSSQGVRLATDTEKQGKRLEKWGEVLAVAPVKVNGFSYLAVFYFRDDKLSAVNLESQVRPEQPEIARWLHRTYGTPLRNSELPVSDRCKLNQFAWRLSESDWRHANVFACNPQSNNDFLSILHVPVDPR